MERDSKDFLKRESQRCNHHFQNKVNILTTVGHCERSQGKGRPLTSSKSHILPRSVLGTFCTSPLSNFTLITMFQGSFCSCHFNDMKTEALTV